MHHPTQIPMYDSNNPDDGGYEAGTEFEIKVTYDWYESPFKDYTVKVYSKWDN